MNSARTHRLARLLLGAACLLALAGCGMTDDEPAAVIPQTSDIYVTQGQEVKTKDISGFCKVQTDRGEKELQEYLANVVSCEAAYSADIEALKAQAIAARSFAMYINHGLKRPLRSSQADQHYACGRPIRALAHQAVKETAGVVGQYNGTLVPLFYKAGSEQQTASCRGIGGGATNTEHFITYNEGKRGSAVQGAYGQPSSNDNRGDMSQWGAVCLERKGKKALDILRFYYGADIETVQLQGSCIANTVDEAVLTDGSGAGAQECTSTTERPDIIERSGWGARPPRSLTGKHTPNRFAIHHAVSPNNLSVSGAERIRGFQDYHMDGHGWPDIGYHFLIDRDGKIYRGTAEDRIGAHVGGQNTGNIGISFLGQYQPPSALGIPAAEPTDEALKSAGKLIRYLADKYNIDVKRSVVQGHRENPGQSTSCPGDLLLNQIPKIITYAGSDVLCGRPERPHDEVRDTPKFNLEATNYKYIKIKATADTPAPYPRSVGGFEVDSVFFQTDRSAPAVYASSVASSSDDVTGASGATGPPNNDSCGSRTSNAAVLGVGEEIVLGFPSTFKSGAVISVVQNEFSSMAGCNSGYSAEVWASPDKENWVKIASDISGNISGLSAPASSVHFQTPRDGASYASGNLNLTVDASPDVQHVEYFIGGRSIGTGTDWDSSFRLAHLLEGEGTYKITARAVGSDGQTVATDTVTITLSDAFRFSSPRPGPAGMSALAPKDATFKVIGGPSEIVTVIYESDGYNVGESSQRSSDFRVAYSFDNLSGTDGFRRIIAYAKNAAGEIIATAELDVLVSAHIQDGLEWVRPASRGWYSPKIRMRTRRLNPEIISVDYEVEDNAVCRSDNPDTNFACTHKFSQRGWVEITAVGYDTKEQLSDPAEREAHTIAKVKIKVFITNEDGTVPGYELGDDDEPLPGSGSDGGGSAPGGGGEADSAMAEKLAVQGGQCSGVGNGGMAARCSNGRGGYSTGQCWGFVKAAVIRSGLATRADIDRLAAKVGMSAYQVQVSASGFTHAADRASPEALASTMGLKKIDVPPSQAPRGAIIGWFAGCRGYHATYGHIEVAMGDGYACSDFCGPVGNASCGRVFVPIK